MACCALLVANSVLTPLTSRRAARHAGAHAPGGNVVALSGTPTIMAFDGQTARAFIGVRNYDVGGIAVVDLRAGRLLSELDVDTRPLALVLARLARRVFVLTAGTDLTRGRGRVIVLDAASGARQRSIAVAGEPNALAVDEARQRVLVTVHTGGGAAVAIYDMRSLALIARLPLEADARPIAITAADGQALVVTSAGRVYLIVEARARVAHVIQMGQGAALVAVDARSGRAFVANPVSNTVGVIDTASGTLLRTVPVGVTPDGLGVSPATRRVLVANAADGTITLLDSRSGTPLRAVAVGADPSGVIVAEHAGLAVIPTAEGLAVVDTASGALLRRIAILNGAAAVALDDQSAQAVVASATASVGSSVVRLVDLRGIPRQAPRPAGASGDRSLAVLRAFVDAYNSHDLPGVLSTLSADIDYEDCRILRGKGEVQAWLRVLFAEHERLVQAHIDVPHGPMFPYLAAITAIRVDDAVQARGHVVWFAAKIGLTHDGGQVRFVRIGPDCPI